MSKSAVVMLDLTNREALIKIEEASINLPL